VYFALRFQGVWAARCGSPSGTDARSSVRIFATNSIMSSRICSVPARGRAPASCDQYSWRINER